MTKVPTHYILVLFIHFLIVLKIILGNMGNIVKKQCKDFCSFCVRQKKWALLIFLIFSVRGRLEINAYSNISSNTKRYENVDDMHFKHIEKSSKRHWTRFLICYVWNEHLNFYSKESFQIKNLYTFPLKIWLNFHTIVRFCV